MILYWEMNLEKVSFILIGNSCIFSLCETWLKIRNDKQLLISNSSECDNLVYWPFWEFYMMHDMTSLVKSFLSFRDWEWHLSGWSQKTHFCLKLNLSKKQFDMSLFRKVWKNCCIFEKNEFDFDKRKILRDHIATLPTSLMSLIFKREIFRDYLSSKSFNFLVYICILNLLKSPFIITALFMYLLLNLHILGFPILFALNCKLKFLDGQKDARLLNFTLTIEL